MATQQAVAPTTRSSWSSFATIAAAVGVLVILGAIGLASIPDVAMSQPGASIRGEQAWVDRLEGLAARQREIAAARERAATAYADRLTGQSEALAGQLLARERASAAYSDRLTQLAQHLAGQPR